MNAYQVLLALVACKVSCKTDAEHENVGTVLFSTDDLHKILWEDKEIDLLRARMHLQGIIPPADMIDLQNEDFIRSVIDYFRSCYGTIKDEAPDVETLSILMTALSDTVGGYLKTQLLPVAKMCYYAGTVEQDNVLKLFQFYDNIKAYLKTDGATWKLPSAHYFSGAITIKPHPLHQPRCKASRSCNNVAYFEMTDGGLSIPIPHINWEDNSMFLPLRDQSLISLLSPNSSDALFNFYDSAKSCIKHNDNAESQSFESKFKDWLINNVMPHLTDDRFYPALAGVLAFSGNDSYEFNNNYKKTNSMEDLSKTIFIADYPIDLSSRKILAIMIVTVLMTLWCIPILCYLGCLKRNKAPKKKNKRGKPNNVYLFVEPMRAKKSYSYTTPEKNNKVTDTGYCWCPKLTANKSVEISDIPSNQMYYNQFDVTKLKLDSLEKASSKNKISRKSRNRQSSTTTNNSTVETLIANYLPNTTCIQTTGAIAETAPTGDAIISLTNVIRQTSTITLPQLSEKPSKRSSVMKNKVSKISTATTVTHRSDRSNSLRGRACKMSAHKRNLNEDSVNRYIMAIQEVEPDNVLSFIDEVNKVDTISKHMENKLPNNQVKPFTNIQSKSKNDNVLIMQQKALAIATDKESRCLTGRQSKLIDKSLKSEGKSSKSKGTKRSGYPVLEITVERPQREICLDITGPPRYTKPSRIPRRAVHHNITQTCSISTKDAETSGNNPGGYLEKPKRYNTLEDLRQIRGNFRSYNPNNNTYKMNTTL